MILVDTNVLIDIILDDASWGEASLRAIRAASDTDELLINLVIYAELAAGYDRAHLLDGLLQAWRIGVADVPRPAAFLARQAFKRYRAAGGTRSGVLPDFFIGAQAQVEGWPLLTRDSKRYRTDFPPLS